jgi:hypothetical protein
MALAVEDYGPLEAKPEVSTWLCCSWSTWSARLLFPDLMGASGQMKGLEKLYQLEGEASTCFGFSRVAVNRDMAGELGERCRRSAGLRS